MQRRGKTILYPPAIIHNIQEQRTATTGREVLNEDPEYLINIQLLSFREESSIDDDNDIKMDA